MYYQWASITFQTSNESCVIAFTRVLLGVRLCMIVTPPGHYSSCSFPFLQVTDSVLVPSIHSYISCCPWFFFIPSLRLSPVKFHLSLIPFPSPSISVHLHPFSIPSPSLLPIQPVSRVLYSENSSCFNIVYEQIVPPWKLGTLESGRIPVRSSTSTYSECIISAVGWQHHASPLGWSSPPNSATQSAMAEKTVEMPPAWRSIGVGSGARGRSDHRTKQEPTMYAKWGQRTPEENGSAL